MRPLALLLLALALTGCLLGGALKEYNYHGHLPSGVVADLPLAQRFAQALATETGLTITSADQPVGYRGRVSHVGLVSAHKPRIAVNIDAVKSDNSLYVQVYGDIATREGKAVARTAEELFARQYPGSKLTPFTRYSGLFGP